MTRAVGLKTPIGLGSRYFSKKVKSVDTIVALKNKRNFFNANPKNILNLLYFHKRRLAVMSLFTMGYYGICYTNTGHASEAVRLGIAGSIANLICECGFHIIDTINIRSKVVSEGAVKQTLRE